ncbi:hypothetical protein [Pseudomonas aeruginosa]|uniref:hypothetical protein n=1 Tax=Pseudomonas aeruginosa TaxID=287 RepID=UPI00053DEEB7|nr:hypothetical protein [Pseudomonas aeruginosa]RCH23906.1 hypothetical protein CSC42_0567 [Pseudomonas aeruginosa]
MHHQYNRPLLADGLNGPLASLVIRSGACLVAEIDDIGAGGGLVLLTQGRQIGHPGNDGQTRNL